LKRNPGQLIGKIQTVPIICISSSISSIHLFLDLPKFLLPAGFHSSTLLRILLPPIVCGKSKHLYPKIFGMKINVLVRIVFPDF